MAAQNSLPVLHRMDFFRYRDDELACAIARAIATHVAKDSTAKLTDQQSAVSAWCAIAINVPNGGFTQFFYNHQGDQGVKELAALLDVLEQSKAADLLREATALYQQHHDEFLTDNPWEGLFGGIEEFEKLDRAFMKVANRCSRAIGSWTLQQIAELVTDETGCPIDPQFTGTVETHYPSGQIKESMEVRKGKPNGVYREYFVDGKIREAVFYKSGKISGDYWPDGQIKRKESKQGSNRVIEWFYPTGALQKRFVMDKNGYVVQPIQLFHENGQLAEELSSIKGKKLGPWLKFFQDGTPQLQAEYTTGEQLVVHNAWNDRGEQIVKDGSGTFRDYPLDIDWQHDVFHARSWIRESELALGIPHGKVTSYNRGVLYSTEYFVDGQRDGESTTYWDNGRIRLVTPYAKGKAGKAKEFPKFDQPVPQVVLSLQADEELYRSWKHPAVDEYPQPINLEEIQKLLVVPQFLHEVYERNLAGNLRDRYEDWNTFDDGIAYFLSVDATGAVIDAHANGSGVYSGGNWDTYPPLLRQLRFVPARVSGNAIPCEVLARVDHKFIESESA